MSTLSLIGILGGLLSLGAYIPRFVRIIQGKERPERAPWLIWTLASTLILLGHYTLGARSTLWVPLAYVIGCAVISILSLKYGREGWGILEKITLGIAIISSIRWIFFDNVALAVLLNLTLSFVTYVPGIKYLLLSKNHAAESVPPAALGYQNNLLIWSLLFIGSAFNIFAVSSWTIETSSLPILLFVMNGIMFALILQGYFTQKSSGAQVASEQSNNPVDNFK